MIRGIEFYLRKETAARFARASETPNKEFASRSARHFRWIHNFRVATLLHRDATQLRPMMQSVALASSTHSTSWPGAVRSEIGADDNGGPVVDGRVFLHAVATRAAANGACGG